ncbi:Vitellogenin-6, partial [Toxocara canis]
YRYLYRGQISSGLPKESTQHAATRIEAHVSLVFPNNERTAVLRLEKVRFGSLNHDIPEPRELQRFEIFEEKEVEEEYLRLLRLPLRFRYVDGLVSEIEFDREDRPWSENIKRAVLNLLQVNLKKNMRTDIHEERNVREDIELLDEHRERREDADFFVAQEPTLEGDCEVYYTINRLPREEKEREELLKVTKSINFEKCSRRIEVRYNHRFGEKCDKCDEESEKERVTKTSTVFNYNIIGNRDKFLVKNAEVKSQYVLAPLGEDEATMRTVVVGRLELLKVDERRERWEEPRSERKQSIIYSPERLIKIERFYMNGDEELREDHPFRLIRHKYELIDQTVSKMVRAISDKEVGIETDATRQMARLVELFRMCSKEELHKVVNEFWLGGKFDEKTKKKVYDIVVDALALAGTKNTIELLVEQIEQRRVSTTKTAKALQTLVNVRVVSERQIDTVLRLCKKDVCERNPLLKQSCLLSVGGMINALCKDNKDRLAIELTEMRICPRELKEKYLRPTLEGDCEVYYTINRLPREEKEREELLKVTKSINFEKCSRRIEVRYNHRFGEKCDKCDEESEKERVTKTSTVFNYNIIGNRDKFLVKNAEVKSQYVLAPLGEDEATMRTVVVGRLELLKVDERRERWEEPRSERKQSIIYSPERLIKIERFYMNGDEELREDHPFRLIRHKYELIDQTVSKMVRAISDKEVGIETDATRQMARLVELFRMCSKEELHKVVNEFWLGGKFDEKTKKKVYDIVVDALALAGTKNTIELLVEQIEQRRVSTTKTAKALQTLVNVRVVSERQIDTVLRLCKKDVCERNPLLKQSCLLSVGGMINALCKDNKDRLAIELTEMRICPRELKEKYLRELMEIFRNAETRYEKVLALKTLANAGIDLSVYELEKIITDRKEERIIRAQAIDALRQLRTVMPRKIQRLLLPVFKDKTEYPEIRITALAQIMHTLPERTVLDQIAEALLHEQSRQVQSFTYSMMRTFAVSRNPCEKRLGEDLRLALNLARVDITNWTDSKYIHIPLFDENRKVGLSLDLASIFTKDSTFPRELMMSLDTIVAKQWRKSNIQLGLVQYNLEEIVEKLVKETEEKSLEDIVVRQRRAASFRPTDILHSLYEKLNIRSRREKSSVYAMAYLRFKNLDFAIVPIDAETLPEALKVMRDGKIDLSRLEGYLTRGCRFQTHFATYFHEVSRRLPTTIGMPLVITDKIPTIIGLEGEFKTVLTPQETKRLNGAKINLQVRPTVAATHLIRMHIWNPVVNSGIKMMQAMRFNLPIDAEVELLVDRKLQLKYRIRVPQEKKQIFTAHTRLVTITSSWPIDSKIYAEPKLKTVPLEKEPQRMRTFEKSFGEKWIGIRLNIRGQWHDNPLRLLQRSPMLLAAGENAIEVTMEKTRDAPREIVSEFDLELLKESRMQKPELEKFYSEKSEDKMFEIDSSEESDEDVWEREERKERRVLRRDENREQLRRREEEERLRRQEFSRYVREYNPQKGYKLRVLMRINAVGSRVERKAEAEISTGCDERMRYCMFVANGRRTPMFEDERRDWTFKTNIQSLYPEPSRNIKELSEKKYREFNAQIQCEWGSERREHINMKIQGEQDREQRELMNRIDRQRSPVERYDEIMEATQLNQYKIVVDYEVCPVERYYFNSLFTLLKSWQLWNSQIFQTENAEKRIFVKVTIDPRTHQFVTLVVETPRETVEIRDIFLPMRIAPLMLNTHRTSYPVRSLRQFVRKTIPEQRAECTVSSRRVNTFDGAELKLPLTTCYSVLAKDCRSAEPRFAVLMKKLRKDSDEKKMKIIDEERVIEMQRVGREIEVRVDGRVENDEEKLERMGINKRYDIVIVELEDVTVHFDGEVASVKVSPWFKNGQCGICGHYDGERDDELRKADNELTDDLEQYHRSYFNKDTECDVEEDVVSKKENYRIRFDEPEDLFEDSEEERERDEEVLKPVLRTHVIEYNQELCFSMKGVPECPKGTYAKESQKTEMKVSFACLSRSRHEALRLARRARTEVINMGDYKPSFVDTIMVPRACVAF